MAKVEIDEDELRVLKDQVAHLKGEVTWLNQVLHRKNLDLDALHFVWCDGGCPGGVHRFASDQDVRLTEEMIERAERNTKRLRSWWNTVKWRLTGYYPTMSEWHKQYAERAASKTDLPL